MENFDINLFFRYIPNAKNLKQLLLQKISQIAGSSDFSRNMYHLFNRSASLTLFSRTGITSTAQEWKAFLAKTLCGALAAPSTLFKKVYFI